MMNANNLVIVGDFLPGKALRTGLPEGSNVFEAFHKVKKMIIKYTASFSVWIPASFYPVSKFPISFHYCLINASDGSGFRSLIDLYTLFAMSISEKLNKPKRKNLIFRKRELSHPNLPGLGPSGYWAISGPADYLIAHSNLNKLSRSLIKTYPGLAEPDDCLFVVLEAKKAETSPKEISATQLLAQVLTLEFG